LGGLYKTTNRGANWTKLTGSKFDRVTSITFDPQNANQAYLTTETQGLWISKDMNTAIPTWNLVTSYPFRQPERVYFNPNNLNELWVTSFGNGMKIGNLSPITRVPSFAQNILSGFNCFPNPNNGSFSVSIYVKQGESSDLQIIDMNGRIVYKQVQSLHVGQNTFKIITQQLNEGIYFVRLSSALESHTLKIIVE